MTNPCLTCRFANWKRTTVGRLHPSGGGRCDWQMPTVILPKSKYYIGFSKGGSPSPAGGYIDRDDDKECSAYEAKP